MADPDAFPILFRRAVAQYLADHSVGVYTTSGYAATDRGIYTNGPTMPTNGDNAVVLGSLSPIAEGRSNMLYRLQVLSRVKGSMIAAENLAALITGALDQREGVPAGFHISRCVLFAEVAFTADSSGRCMTSQTFHFTGRRQP